jgi:hypothetical protein
MVFEISRKIEQSLIRIAHIQGPYVRRVCPRCEAPCCSRIRYLYDEKDLMFIRISGQKVNPRKRDRHRTGCSFLAHAGCVLEPLARPFTCHRYVCPELEKEMGGKGSPVMVLLSEEIRFIDHLRSALWEAYLEAALKGDCNRSKKEACHEP